jgi:tetratricopeptide (TPR) repeat protein
MQINQPGYTGLMTMPKDWKPPSSYSYKSSGSDNIQTSSNFQRILTPSNSQVFISYAREDQQAGMRLYNELKTAGLNPWIDRKRILPGQKWEKEIEKAIKNSAYFIPLFSSNSVEKLGYVQNEFSFALDIFEKFEHIAGFKVFYIPLRLDDCYVPYEKLRSVQITDMFPFEQNWEEGVQGIIQVVNQDVNTANNLFTYLKTADMLSDLKKYDEAILWYDKALRIDSNSNILLGKGYCLRKLERYDEAIECFKAVLNNPYNEESLILAWAEIGDCLFSLERYLGAVQCYDRSLELDPAQHAVWSVKGNALNKLGRYTEAIRCCDRSLELDPAESGGWNVKGKALYYLGRYREAIECYTRALELDSSWEGIWCNKGDALSELKRYHEAIECYTRALELDPHSSTAWNNKGVTLGELGRYEEAIECFDRSLELEPDTVTENNRAKYLNALNRRN